VRFELTTLDRQTISTSELYSIPAPFNVQLDNTGNRFRSCVLGIMSPARYLCAMPVGLLMFYVARAMTAYFFKAREL